MLLQEQDAFVPSVATLSVSIERDHLKQEHFRYKQKINNVPVECAVYVVHVHNGKVLGLNGDWIATFPEGLVKAPVINECQAQKSAMAAFAAVRYKWQVPEEVSFIKQESGDPNASFRPNVELVYYSGEQLVEPALLRLAWKVDLYAHEPLSRRIYFIDAEK